MTQSLRTKLNNTFLYQFLFYKHFYPFVFLHKPLCSRYRNHTIKIFGLYVCKSCLLLYFGFLLTLFLLIPKIEIVKYNKFFILGLCGCLLTFIASYPPIYFKFSRLTKDFIRLYDGIFLAAIFVICFKINILVGILSILAFIFVRNMFNKKRSGDRICKGCKHLEDSTTCEGYKLQKEALLKIDEEYSNIRMRQTMERMVKND